MKAVTLSDFTEEKGYAPKGSSGWMEIAIDDVVSINIAEFYKNNDGCVRVVHFTVEQLPLDAVEVVCDSSPLHTGLVLHDDRFLMYYTMIFIKLGDSKVLGTILQDYYSVRVIDESSCNYVSILKSTAR